MHDYQYSAHAELEIIPHMITHPSPDPSSAKNEGDFKKDIALKLFIEILSYQLAFPVRWIETQHEFFQNHASISRFIEIGPRTTLSTMAKKSAAILYRSRAPSQWSHMQFLSFQDNQSQIFYQYPDLRQSATSKSKDPAKSIAPLPELPAPIDCHQRAPTTAAPASRVAPTVDISLSASHIVLAIAAQKLRRAFDQVQLEKTIRDLAGGKSTLQNELMGDLVSEFGRVPVGVEDMSLVSLARELQHGFAGMPAKAMTSLISKLISRKMPAGFNQTAILEYLECRWGLSKSHALIPICFATTMEPPNRLPGLDEARVFLDNVVARYTRFQGISLEPLQGKKDDSNALNSTAMIDATTLGALDREQKRLYHAQFQALARYLNLEPHIQQGHPSSEDMLYYQNNRLQKWQAELEEQYLEGIKPIFSVDRARIYDSWWNWVREDIMCWLNEISLSPSEAVLPTKHGRLQMILNRWEPSCTDIVTSIPSDLLPRSSTSPPLTNKIRFLLGEMARLGAKAKLIDPVFIFTNRSMCPRSTISASGQLEYNETIRNVQGYPDTAYRGHISSHRPATCLPFVHIKTRKDGENWRYDSKASSLFNAMLDVGATVGLTYSGKTVLVTGAGPESIASHIVQGLLSGGARLIVTTTGDISSRARFYQQIYRKFGAKESSLTLIPMNQGSKQDCESLIQYIYGPSSPVGGDLDYVIPFAAIPQTGGPDKVDSRQELALRTMLVNILRLVGSIFREKEQLRIKTRPTMVILPMSCNEGTFGGDGLYPESKIGLKTLFNRFHSENWSKYIKICGTVIGWTRGTSLMRSSNTLAEEVEKLGVITFTQAEMAFNILAIMTPTMMLLAEDSPIYADFTGGLGSMWNIKEKISTIRNKLSEKTQLQAAIFQENAHHRSILYGFEDSENKDKPARKFQRANLSLDFPPLPEIDESLPNLQGMVNLSHVAVVVGFSELGPWGSARTRWEIEHRGKFSLEGYIELAWMMGYIKHVNGQVKGQPYVGWVDMENQNPVRDDEVPKRYHDRIMSNTGLRIIENNGDFNPAKKEFLHEVAIEEDLPPFECSRSTAEAFKLKHGDHIIILPIPSSDICHVYVKKGAVIMIPKIIPFHQVVAGNVPNGWDPLRYGIPEDIVQQVDTTTLYALCCVSDAFLSAGIKDPYELYQYIHVSELTNCLGTGGGPLKVIQNMYRDRFLDRQMRGDIILDHFLNSMGAWVNMLLLSASGPLKTPVGACATALESLDIGCDAIQSGKCKVAIVGGSDDHHEELAYEFANIKATADCREELAKGRIPSEMSRPSTSSRCGFTESAGCGVQILMSAELALEIGLPIYGIVGYTQMASDQTGRSIPAPGQGILTAARETSQARSSPYLDLQLRRANLDSEVAEINQRYLTVHPMEQQKLTEARGVEPVSILERAANLKIQDAQTRWANDIRRLDPSIAPIRAALATWALSIDDIKVVSMHGTSTIANDVNEADVLNTQMNHLGRQKGNPLLAVCQKSLTGHPKAAAGAWQLNGCLQMLRDNIVPGNRNADNIDRHLRKFESLVFPMESIRVPKIKATMLTSFGFGQKGAINLMVSPRYLFASLPTAELQEYRTRVAKRQRTATPNFVSRLIKNSLVEVKHQPPWSNPDALQNFFLNPNSRAIDGQPLYRKDASKSIYLPNHTTSIPTLKPQSNPKSISSTIETMLETLLSPGFGSGRIAGIGVDVEDIASINIDNDTFVERNFTPTEREYCLKTPSPHASLAGRWSAKEAVFKSLQTSSAGAGAAMSEIEIASVHGIPKAILYGRAREIATSQGVGSIKVTISHTTDTAIAVALATKDDLPI